MERLKLPSETHQDLTKLIVSANLYPKKFTETLENDKNEIFEISEKPHFTFLKSPTNTSSKNQVTITFLIKVL